MRTQKNQEKTHNWDINSKLGAKRILERFLKLAERNLKGMPHAFLFLGPKGIGKSELAREFSGQLRKIAPGSQIFEFNFEDTGDIDQLRELLRLSSLKNLGGGKSIFILHNFDQASVAAGNAMLKTLEEPSADSMFMVVASRGKAMPTIMSRSIIIRCYPATHIYQQGGDEESDLAVSGYTALAQKYEQAGGIPETFQKLLAILENQEKKSKLVFLSQMTDVDNESLLDFLQLWLLRQIAKLKSGQDVVASLKAVTAGQAALDELSKNYNTKLVLQEFLLKI